MRLLKSLTKLLVTYVDKKGSLAHRDIVNLMNFKNCMNHVTVIMQVSSIGDYRYEQFTGFVDFLAEVENKW